MALKIGKANVEVGDLLRRAKDYREGRVTKVTNKTVTLSLFQTQMAIPGMNPETEVTLPVEECHYNTWDPKFPLSGKTPPVLQPTNMAEANSKAVAEYQALVEKQTAEAEAAVKKARAEAEETRIRIEAEKKTDIE